MKVAKTLITVHWSLIYERAIKYFLENMTNATITGVHIAIKGDNTMLSLKTDPASMMVLKPRIPKIPKV